MEDAYLSHHRTNLFLIKIFWGILLFSILSEIVGISIETFHGAPDLKGRLIDNFLVPTIFLSGCIGLAHWAVKCKIAGAAAILVTLVVVTGFIILKFPQVSGIHNALILPIFVSAIYYERTKILFTFLCSLSIFIMLLIFYEPIRSRLDYPQVFMSLTNFIIYSVLAYAIVERGLHLIERLKSTMEDRQRLQLENMLKDHLANFDGLTEAYNRRAFMELGKERTEIADRSGRLLALILFDIDNFKQVNDSFGHHIGDYVLREVADGAKQSVGRDDLVCRYGGEEFAILVGIDREEELPCMLNSLTTTIQQIRHDEMGSRAITVSGGVVMHEQGQNLEDMIIAADRLLYEAKRTGKNKILGLAAVC